LPNTQPYHPSKEDDHFDNPVIHFHGLLPKLLGALKTFPHRQHL
jgi:hypothetical protein